MRVDCRRRRRRRGRLGKSYRGMMLDLTLRLNARRSLALAARTYVDARRSLAHAESRSVDDLIRRLFMLTLRLRNARLSDRRHGLLNHLVDCPTFVWLAHGQC